MDISSYAKRVEQWADKLTSNLEKAQDEVADEIYQEIYQTARGNGGFKLSVYRTPTMNNNGCIETGFGSNAFVISSKGKMYNLGWLLEVGTSPHLIEPLPPFKALHFQIDGKDVFAKYVNHPGSRAFNTFKNAKDKYAWERRKKYLEAIKESFK